MLDSETPALSRGALVQESGSLTGMLCPNPRTLDGRHLDDVLGSGFAVVTTQQLSAGDRTAAEMCRATVYVTDPGSELGDWLRRGRAAAAIIRPDRTVLRAGPDLSPLFDSLGSCS